MKARIKRWLSRAKQVKLSRKQLLVAVGVFTLLVIVGQLVYPSNRLLPFLKIDGLSVGAWSKKDAAWKLDKAYQAGSLQLFFGNNTQPRMTARPSDVGLQTSNSARLERLDYPWYIRLVPTSLVWYGLLQRPVAPEYHHSAGKLDDFISKQLDNCDIKPLNASLVAKNGQVKLVPAINGGICETSVVKKTLGSIQPTLTKQTAVKLPVKEITPQITDSQAEKLAHIINRRLSGNLTVVTDKGNVTLSSKAVASWLEFSHENAQIVVQVNTGKAAGVFNKEIAPKVAIQPGVSKVATRDFVELSRINGPPGRALDVGGTGQSIVDYLQEKSNEIKAATLIVAPRVEYTRTYSPTDAGLSALMTNYAKDHPGTYGVQLIELSGSRRRAGFNETKQFVTASTYKLFVAFGTLKKIETGEWRWTDQVTGGRNAALCFDDMIVKSDNACAEALLERYGYNNLTKDIRALGLSSASGFIGDSPKSTAGDLALFMAMLESGQLPIQPPSREKFIGALKRNIYRQGIPAGSAGTVANKVGFMGGLLHDAAIVYSPSGTYVLTVMTDGAKWSNIAELTREIEKLRSQ